MLAPRELRSDQLLELARRAVALGRSAATTGEVTTKIPRLAAVDRSAFGLAVTTVDGAELGVGDSTAQFSLQSLTKLFALVALLRVEPGAWMHVGWAPTELGYGSVTELERAAGRPRNPFVNAGALIVTDRLLHHTGSAVDTVAALICDLSGDPAVASDAAVSASEAAADHRNRALAHVLAEHGRLLNDVDAVLAHYYAQCAITGSALGMARAGRFLADRRLHEQVLDSDNVRRINAVLLTSGMYGAAGDIAYRVGLPAKSGVGGGVLAALPGVGTVCAWSPPLDAEGNSVGGVAAIEEFARTSGWSVF
ncbi:glutaminase A [Nocardioides ginsengisoli]|uniref:Glutaminase n=1 Tax=Nocardioides ginsengisoli TaxID=363868 RepID=A0ABW3VXB7_9ACTN